MPNIFAGLAQEFDTSIEGEVVQKNNVRKTKAYYIKETENYRIQINKTRDLVEKLKLCLRLISDLTGDEVFYKQNLKEINSAEDILKRHIINQSTAAILDLSRRYITHKQCFEAEKTPINQYLYEASKNDFELAVYNLEQLQNPTAECADKIIELEKERKRLQGVYRMVVLNEQAEYQKRSGYHSKVV